MPNPIDVIANAIRTADGNHTMGAGQLAEVAATVLTTDEIVDNAVAAVRAHPWTGEDVEDISDRRLRTVIRIAL